MMHIGGVIMRLTEIGTVLKEARKAANLAQEQLAGPLGMSRATISALENGRCEEIGFAKLAALLAVVGLEITVGPRRARPTIDELRAECRDTRKAAALTMRKSVRNDPRGRIENTESNEPEKPGGGVERGPD
jgi:transcriptional regulator with XRE-family HTH domain